MRTTYIDIAIDQAFRETGLVIRVRGIWMFRLRLVLTRWILQLAEIVAGVPLEAELSEDGRRPIA